MTFVLDASVTLAWAFTDEASPYADVVFDRLSDETAFVPDVWWLEVLNTLLIGERRRRLTITQSMHLVESLEALPIIVEGDAGGAEPGHLLSLARRLGLTVYDASYVDLALRHDLPLATLDTRMRAACQRSGIMLVAV